jgi:hypothetical protein
MLLLPKRDKGSSDFSMQWVDTVTQINDLSNDSVTEHLLSSSTSLGTHVCHWLPCTLFHHIRFGYWAKDALNLGIFCIVLRRLLIRIIFA